MDLQPAERGVILRSARLLLRPVQLSDEAVMVRELNDIAVTGWLSRVPHPYLAADFQAFATELAVTGETFVIEDAGGVAGVIGLETDILGYWLAVGVHGRGYATEAARCVLEDHFTRSDTSVESGYFIGNTRSARVLEKLGFTQTGLGLKHCTALNMDRPHAEMVLSQLEFGRSKA